MSGLYYKLDTLFSWLLSTIQNIMRKMSKNSIPSLYCIVCLELAGHMTYSALISKAFSLFNKIIKKRRNFLLSNNLEVDIAQCNIPVLYA